MKVAILSMQQIKNYGSFLQAFSLKKNIESLGHTCEFINIIPGEQLEEDIRPVVFTILNYFSSAYGDGIFTNVSKRYLFFRIVFEKSSYLIWE